MIESVSMNTYSYCYEIYSKTSINNLSFNKITKVYLNYIIFRFIKNLKIILPMKTQIILKKNLKKLI
jgi:hypothetical protein